MKILWVSRHKMTSEQTASLNRLYGNCEIISVDRTFKSAEEIADYCDWCDIYAVVLPTDILISLFNIIPEDKIVLIPCSERKPNGTMTLNPATNEYEPEYQFVYKCWKKVLKAQFETEDLF
mgnify:CR=1 FL=1